MRKQREIAVPAARRINSTGLRLKLIVCSLLLFGDIFGVMSTRLFAQDSASQERPQAFYTVIPPKGGVSAEAIRAGSANATSIPLWTYSIKSPLDNNTYSGTMVGRSPFFHGARTTNIPVVIVPLIMKFSTGATFDPTATDSTCSPSGTPLALTQQSPIFVPLDIQMGGTDIGITQYEDAFQRGNFFSEVSPTGARYHTVLSPVTTLSAVTVTIPAADGTVFSDSQFGGCGGTIGVMNINWFDPEVTGTIIPSLASSGVGPTTFPIFVLKNVVMTSGTPSFPSNCCILGYHGAFGSPLQTYSPFDYDTSGIFSGVHDVSTLGHEAGEWMDDPVGTNPTPAWGHTGQVSGCQSNLEVGDPLSGTDFPALTESNGFAYHPQELAFFSWFYRQVPSIGVNGFYSDNDTFSSDAGAACN
jgi:hypothetical protein